MPSWTEGGEWGEGEAGMPARMEGVDSQREETGVLTWKDVIGSEKEQAYFMDTLATVRAEREAGKVIYPPATEVFNAFKLTELDDVKVVILGQDPYHGRGHAEGLAFSVQGTDWTWHDKAYLVLHKPAGTECSQKPSTWPSIYTLLPGPLRQREAKARPRRWMSSGSPLGSWAVVRVNGTGACSGRPAAWPRTAPHPLTHLMHSALPLRGPD